MREDGAMSRAFVKEADETEVYDLPDRPISDDPNFVTARGLALIEAEVAKLRGALEEAQEKDDRGAIAEISRDLRYWTARRATAEVVAPPAETDTVRFGLSVTIKRDDGQRQTYRIVGQDEADPAKGLLSFLSPLGRALAGKGVGDTVVAGPHEAEIVAIENPPQDAR
jgi:transcription elongation GreA/GreB family factor